MEVVLCLYLKNKLIKNAIREKLKSKTYDFTDEELLYLEIRRSALPTRERNSLLRAGLKYFHEFLCLENPKELNGVGINHIKTVNEYIKDYFELFA